MTFVGQIAVAAPVVESTHPLPWFTFKDGRYYPYDQEKKDLAATIFLLMTPQQHTGERLLIRSRQPMDLLINGKLVEDGQRYLLLSVDSLLNFYHTSRWIMTVHCRENVSSLQTLLLKKSTEQRNTDQAKGPAPRTRDFFRDFVVVATLVILMLVAMAKAVNQKLLSDYFSLPQLFLGRDTDEAMHYGRMIRSSNLLFYILCALMMGLFMHLVLAFSPAPLAGFWNSTPTSFFSALRQWLLLTLVVALSFVVKWVLVFLTSHLFGFPGIVRHYLFNWIRTLLLVLAPFLILMVGYYLIAGGNAGLYHFLFGAILWVLLFWIFIILYKVRVRVGFSLFHIICYLCITELIPLLILSKILYA